MIDEDHNGMLESQELSKAAANKEIKKTTANYIVQHSSEWDKNINMADVVLDIYKEHKDTINNFKDVEQHYKNQRKRIADLEFFSKCKGIKGFPKSDMVYHFNPIGLVEVFKLRYDVFILSKQDIIDIIKVTSTEVPLLKNETAFSNLVAGVVDTILNRAKSKIWGKTVRDVVNAHRQFSKITGPSSLSPYGSVQKMPWEDISKRVKEKVIKHLEERSNSEKSIIGTNLHYANKYYSDEYNRKKWVDAFHDEAVKNKLVLGAGKAVHAHGTLKEFKSKKPKPFIVDLPNDFPKGLE